MFASRQQGTVIAKGLKIVGSVTAEGLVEVNGQIDGELHCTSLVIARGAQVNGTVTAERVVVDGNVEGPIQHRPASRAATCPLLAAVTVQSRARSPLWN